MKNFSSLVLVLLFAWSAAGQYFNGVALVGPFTKSAFSCLHQQGYTRFTIRISKVSGTPGIDPHGVDTLNNALNALSIYPARSYDVYLYIQICRGQDAWTQVNAAKSAVAAAHIPFSNVVWIKVEPNSTPGCSWDGYTQMQNCYFVSGAVNAVNAWTGLPGVFSTARIWERYFGSNCDWIGTSFPYPWLWYANYDHTGHVNSTQSFADYTTFGGWTVNGNNPYLKQVGGNVTLNLCTAAWRSAFVDLTWSSQ